MKICTLSLLTLLAAIGCGVSYASDKPVSGSKFIAPGVDPGYLIGSERFYDNGKGYFYWPNESNQGTVEALYEESGNNWDFLGDLSGRIPEGATPSGEYYTNLTNDSNACWYYVGSNLLQYWQTYYGVFYQGNGDAGNDDHTLPHGYTYDKEHISALGGTQSLSIGMLFYDNSTNVGGNIPMSANWYLKGDKHSAITGKAKAGFFKEYFGDGQSACQNIYRKFSLEGLRDVLITGFGLAKNSDGSPVRNSDGSLMQSTVGQLVEFDIFTNDGGGHAVTCYGMELDDAGNLTAVYLANSDDGRYQLERIFVGSKDGKVYLYADEAHTQPWMGTSWYVGQIGYITTPESLQNMYAQYADAENPLVWNGKRASGGTWDAGDAGNATVDVLPTEATGWDVLVNQGEFTGHYHSYYQENRAVEFNDHGGGGTVTVAEGVSAPKLILSASSVSYSFTGSDLTVGEIVQSGPSGNSFSGITVHADDTTISAGALIVAKGGTLKSTRAAVGAGGTFALAEGGADIGTMNVGRQGTFAVTQSGSSYTGSLTMEEGSFLRFDLSGATGDTPMLTFTGTITLGGTVELDITAATTGTYSLFRFSGDTSGFTNANWADLLQCYDGTLRFESNTLLLDYKTFTWNTGTGTWTASKWNGGSAETNQSAVVFSQPEASGTADITVNGTVSPGTIAITGGSFRFIEATGTGGTIGGSGNVTISGGAQVSTELNFTGRRVDLQEGASLTYELSGSHDIHMLTTESGTSTTFTTGNGDSATYTILETNGLYGALEVGGGSTLEFKLGRDLTISGPLTVADDAALRFRNTSTAADITYALAGDSSGINGRISVGSAEDAHGTTLSISGNTSATYELAANGTLALNGTATFSGTAEGSGTVEVAADAAIHFTTDATKGNKLSLSGGNTLLIHGQVTAGTANSATDYMGGSDASITVAAGGTLLSYLNKRQSYSNQQHDNTGATFSRITLDGGTATMSIGADAAIGAYYAHSPLVNINELHITEQGGTFVLSQDNRYSGFNTAEVAQLSGSGNLEFRAENADLSPLLLNIQRTASGYTGDLTIHAQADSYSPCDDGQTFYSGNALAELHEGSLGEVSLVQSGESTYTHTGFGVAGDVLIRGLSGNERSYIYSGEANVTSHDVIPDSNFAGSMATLIKGQSHKLTIDSDSDHSFSGSILKGTASGSESAPSLSIIKKGAGKQSFLGNNAGLQGGDFTVEGGALEITGDLTAASVAIAVGTEFICNGGTLSVSSTLSVTAPASSQAGVQRLNSPATAATLNAGLDLSRATSLNLGGTLDLANHALTLGSGTLTLSLTGDWIQGTTDALDLTLFAGLSSLKIGNTEYKGDYSVGAKQYLSGDLITDDTLLVYNSSAATLSLTGLKAIPEPATATLGLLALAGLLLRRRRCH